MIFATVGTHAQPFGRFFAIVDAVRELGHELVVQHGTNPPPRQIERAAPFMAFDELVAHVEEAEAVITHAGVGSILTARRAGHRPLVVARLRRHGEHVDDHQDELTRRLAQLGHVVALKAVEEVPAALARATAAHQRARHGPNALHIAVREALLS